MKTLVREYLMEEKHACEVLSKKKWRLKNNCILSIFDMYSFLHLTSKVRVHQKSIPSEIYIYICQC